MKPAVRKAGSVGDAIHSPSQSLKIFPSWQTSKEIVHDSPSRDLRQLTQAHPATMRLTLAASLLALLAVFTPNAADAAVSTFYLSPQGAACVAMLWFGCTGWCLMLSCRHRK